MHRSAIALLLSAALVNADFRSPNRGENLNVNEAFTIEWDTDGLVEPLTINLVPAGPGDFVVAQQVALDIENSGTLEFIPDVSITNFDAFQFVLTDSEGNSIDSEPFEIDGLTEDPIEATVTLNDVQTVVATGADGAVITEFVTSAREEVASIPADPIRLAVSGGETVNQVLTAAPLVQQLSPVSGGVSLQSNDQDSGFQVAGGVVDDGSVDTNVNTFNPGSVGNPLELDPSRLAINPGDPRFVDIEFVGAGGFLGGEFRANPGGQNPFNNPAAGGVQIQTAEVLNTADVFQTGIDGALSFNPVATPAAATAVVNTLVGADPAAVTVAPLDVGAVAQEGALTVAPLSGGFTPLGGAAASAASAGVANLAVGGGVNSVNSLNGNVVGGIGNSNGAVTFQPLATGPNGALATGAPLNGGTNVLAPSLGSPNGGSVLPGLSNPGGLPLQTGIPLGGGLANPNSELPGGLVGGTPAAGGGLIAPTNTGLLGGTGAVTLQTSILGASGRSTGLLPQATSGQVTVNAADKAARSSIVLGAVVGLVAAIML